jgi:transcriptional regulator with PAS, ATPase and Fis domain
MGALVPDRGETLSQADFLDSRAFGRTEVLSLEMECDRPLVGPWRHPIADVRSVRIGRGIRRDTHLTRDGTLELAVPDRWMSVNHAELRRAGESWIVHDLASKNGTLVHGRRISAAAVLPDELIQIGHTLFRVGHQQLPAEAGVQRSGSGTDTREAIWTSSPALADVLARAGAVAPARISVLILGESGTGKELLAREIHARSGRRGAFVAVNCGAIPSNLVESELFGYRRGAFSGADQDRIGLVQAADGGTLFLDEVGDLSPGAQAALLRVLQEGEVQRVGSQRAEPVEFRVIAATHRALGTLAREGTFRHDLLARLNGLTLELPPLRDRPEDIPVLVAELLRRLAPERTDLKISPAAALALLEYHWPLNVRELEQALKTGVALAGAGVLDSWHLPSAVREPLQPSDGALTNEEARRRDELHDLLRQHRGNVTAVARVLGKRRTQIGRWVKRYGLAPAAFRAKLG